MNLYKKIIQNEVFVAIGCTEPVACAYCAAIASDTLCEPFETLHLIVDQGTLKNGTGVVVPFTNGRKGNLIAAVLGALIGDSRHKLEVLAGATASHREYAHNLINNHKCTIECDETKREFYVEVRLEGKKHKSRCILQSGHTQIHLVEFDSTILQQYSSESSDCHTNNYRKQLGQMKFNDLMDLVENLDKDDIDYIWRGIHMNLAMTESGKKMKKTAFQLEFIKNSGYLADDMFYQIKIAVAAAIDARMAGEPLGAMTSGGSGNQGLMTILVCYLAGTYMGIEQEKIVKSIALAHVINSYTKSFMGELSAMCGCAMCSGIAISAALIYQQLGINLSKITLAVNNVIGDLSGLICDGAKAGCAFKAISSVDSALRGFLMASAGYGLSSDDGLLGTSAQQSIENMSKVTLEGMFKVDSTLVKILQGKNSLQ